jgi:subtilisin family serine protease
MTISAAEQGRFGAAFEWLGVERAWIRTRGSPDVLIAVIDDGPGTHAAGVAAGQHGEVPTFSGVAPGARVLSVRYSALPGGQAPDLAHAIEYAVEHGACIINLSPAANLQAPDVQRAAQYAATRNVLLVCPAGDAVPDAAAAPDAPNVIRVLSVDEDLQPLDGVAPAHVGAVHLAAPGVARVPHWHGSGHTLLKDAGIGAAYVSGCAALVKALNPGWGYQELKEHLAVSGTPQPHLTAHCQYGHVLNVAQAVLGPLEHVDGNRTLVWSSLNDATVHWRKLYRSALCVNAVALYRPHGDEHWRELAFARMSTLRMTVPAASLRRSSGTLRLACRDANFHADDIELSIR